MGRSSKNLHILSIYQNIHTKNVASGKDEQFAIENTP